MPWLDPKGDDKDRTGNPLDTCTRSSDQRSMVRMWMWVWMRATLHGTWLVTVGILGREYMHVLSFVK